MICRIAASMIVLAAVAAGARVQAALPFAEDFNLGTANWKFSNAIDLTPVSAGGPDTSGYVTRTFAFSSLTNPAATSTNIFRAQAPYGSSGGAYMGNWAADGVKQVTAWVRHTASQPLVFNARIAQAANTPGGSYYTTAAVPAGAWTPIVFDVTEFSPQHVAADMYENSTWNNIFSNVGNIQFGINIPASLVGSTSEFTFDLDRVRVSTVPEPATCSLAALGLVGVAGVVRRRR